MGFTSTVVQRTRTCWMASTKTPECGFTSPTAQMAASSPLYSTGTSFLEAGGTRQAVGMDSTRTRKEHGTVEGR